MVWRGRDRTARRRQGQPDGRAYSRRGDGLAAGGIPRLYLERVFTRRGGVALSHLLSGIFAGWIATHFDLPPIPAAMQNQTMMGWHTMLDLIEAGLRGAFPKRADLFPKNAA